MKNRIKSLKENKVHKQEEAENGPTEINIREAIIQGSFLPVIVMTLAGKFPVNEYIVDRQ